jgi:hypothetical protein
MLHISFSLANTFDVFVGHTNCALLASAAAGQAFEPLKTLKTIFRPPRRLNCVIGHRGLK